MRRIILLAATVALVATASAFSQAGRGEKYAFLVVCARYNSTQLHDLPHTVEEMEDFLCQVRVKTKAEALKFKGGVEQVPEVRAEYKGGGCLIAAAKAVAKAPDDAPQLSAKKAAEDPLIREMNFVNVSKGTFWMGWESEKKQSEQVTIANDFKIAAYTVTQEQWEAVMGSNPSFFSRKGEGKDDVKSITDADLKRFPVEKVSWNDIQGFLEKLNEREKGKGWTYRLPTSAEWEYACRGAATSKEDCSFDFYVGKPSNDLSSTQANFHGDFPAGNGAKGPSLGRTTNVGSYVPNKLGLYDMHGNVWQWCQDLLPAENSARVLRGGSWCNLGRDCQAAYRSGEGPDSRYQTIGFRLVAVFVGAK